MHHHLQPRLGQWTDHPLKRFKPATEAQSEFPGILHSQEIRDVERKCNGAFHGLDGLQRCLPRRGWFKSSTVQYHLRIRFGQWRDPPLKRFNSVVEAQSEFPGILHRQEIRDVERKCNGAFHGLDGLQRCLPRRGRFESSTFQFFVVSSTPCINQRKHMLA